MLIPQSIRRNRSGRKSLAAVSLSLLFLVMALEPVWPEVVTDRGLSLRAVVQQAYVRHPRQQVITARGEDADALHSQAGSWLAGGPAVSVRHQNDAVGSREGVREWETGLELPLWWPGQRQAKRAVAERASAGVASSDRALMLEVAGQARESIGELRLAENRAALARHEWETARALERDVQKRMEAGELARTDLLLAQDETLRRKADSLRAEAELRQARDRYRMLTGLEALPADAAEKPASADAVPDDHPLLDDAKAKAARSQAESQLARHEWRDNPQVTVGTRHEKDIPDQSYSNTIGVIVRVPLGSRAHAAPKLAAADLALAEARSALDSTRRELEIALRNLTESLAATREELAIAREQNRLAQENLRLARRAFSLGEMDLVGLLRVQAIAFNAERASEQRALQLDLDIARRNQALGMTP